MFFSQDILTRKGGCLGIVWIAANFQPGIHRVSLTRREYSSVNISKACEAVLSPAEPMALRLSASLMVGIVRVHRQQTHYVYAESKSVMQRIKTAYDRAVASIDLPVGQTRLEVVTLPDLTAQVSPNTTFPGDYYDPSLDFLAGSMADVFSMTAFMTTISDTTPHHLPPSDDGSPYTADPKDISMEEDNEAPLDVMQIQVPGTEDFGEGELRETGQGVMVMVDNVPMPAFNLSNDMECGPEIDSSFGSGCNGAGVGGAGVQGEGQEDSVLLFDEHTNTFQLYKEQEEQPIAHGLETPTAPPHPPNTLGARHTTTAPGNGAPKPVRRRLAFDASIKMQSNAIKSNMATAESTLKNKHALCHPLPRRVKPALLLSQPSCATTLQSPRLLAEWRKNLKQPEFENEKEFELDPYNPHQQAEGYTTQDRPQSSLSVLSDQEVAREESKLTSLATSSLEVARGAVEDGEGLLDSHLTTSNMASLSDISSSLSTHPHPHHHHQQQQLQPSLRFETSSMQRQAIPSRRLSMGGLSPIPDVDRETETSFRSQPGGDLHFPDLDTSYASGSAGDATPHGYSGGLAFRSPAIGTVARNYLREISIVMGSRLVVEFDDVLPRNSSRRTACRAFSHILELVNSQTLKATQPHPYGPIKLSRGLLF